MALEGKTAVVSGAAMGIGRAVTEILLENGAKVEFALLLFWLFKCQRWGPTQEAKPNLVLPQQSISQNSCFFYFIIIVMCFRTCLNSGDNLVIGYE